MAKVGCWKLRSSYYLTPLLICSLKLGLRTSQNKIEMRHCISYKNRQLRMVDIAAQATEPSVQASSKQARWRGNLRSLGVEVPLPVFPGESHLRPLLAFRPPLEDPSLHPQRREFVLLLIVLLCLAWKNYGWKAAYTLGLLTNEAIDSMRMSCTVPEIHSLA